MHVGDPVFFLQQYVYTTRTHMQDRRMFTIRCARRYTGYLTNYF
jgi:hypothetical protein